MSHTHRANVPAKQTGRYAQPQHGVALAVARTLHGDVNAFNELVLTYQQLAFSVAVRILQSSDLTEDVVQESFLKAFCALNTFHSGLSKSWLMRIVINNCYDVMRNHRRYKAYYQYSRVNIR
jgi:DNA-directed RNA polymerase specialized sigma24 family protein